MSIQHEEIKTNETNIDTMAQCIAEINSADSDEPHRLHSTSPTCGNNRLYGESWSCSFYVDAVSQNTQKGEGR